jgi:hypothetical protein
MSFRKYGGLGRNAKNNIVRNGTSIADKQYITNTFGDLNSKIVSQSHLDIGGSSLMNVANVYYPDGCKQSEYIERIQSLENQVKTLTRMVKQTCMTPSELKRDMGLYIYPTSYK